VIPKECFEQSTAKSLFYLFHDIATAVAFVYVCSQFLSTDLPDTNHEHASKHMAVWVFGWTFYAFWMGTIMTGLWVIAHECGHGAFSSSKALNDVVGFILHQFLLVPYFPWQFTHAKHHRCTNHLTDGETHVPELTTPRRLGAGVLFNEIIGDDGFAVFQIFIRLSIGWPAYLLGWASTAMVAHDGTLLNGRRPDHFRPNSAVFPAKMAPKVIISTVAEVSLLTTLFYLQKIYGALPMVLWYWGPYLVVNCWLVSYTWLHHTDPSIPHYDEKEWTWMKGALSTIDRDYGIFDYFHHDIGSTHIVHHVFHEIPFYHARQATEAIKKHLEPKKLYNFDPTLWWEAMWRIAHRCHYVDSVEGIQYYKSVNDATNARKRKML